MIRRLVGRVLIPVIRRVVALVPAPDPWERLGHAPPPHAFGAGSRNDFAWYFEGESTVHVASLDDVLAWMEGCAYVSDPEQFREHDRWQHPREFESLRRGDCEDFALWAWRKLVELGYDAELVVGRSRFVEGDVRHAWIVFRHGGDEFLYEPSRRRDEGAVVPLAEVHREYIPSMGVSRERKTFAFAGYRLLLRHAPPDAKLPRRRIVQPVDEVPLLGVGAREE